MVIAGIVIAALTFAVALSAWLWPRSPKGRTQEPVQSVKDEAPKEEILRLLRDPTAFPGQRPVTGSGLPLVWEEELLEKSNRLRRLGELQLHAILLELEFQEIVSHPEHQGNQWFARY